MTGQVVVHGGRQDVWRLTVDYGPCMIVNAFLSEQ